VLAIGQTASELHVRGDSSLISGTTVVNVVEGGLLALPSNSGRFRTDDIIVMPQVEITAGIQLSDCVRLFAGYGFIYWNEVVRPSEQLPTIIDPGQVPTSPTFGNPTTGAPLPAIVTGSYWSHGLNAGVALRF
jgi:hypothetical protein